MKSFKVTSKDIKERVHYERNPPACRSCVHYEKRKLVLRDSLPECRTSAQCKKHLFTTFPNAICDDWEDSKGNILDSQVAGARK